jgi:hypothetical protein
MLAEETRIAAAERVTAGGLRVSATEFTEKFNKFNFLVEHRLANEPAFALPRLIELARTTANTRPSDLYYDVGQVGIGQRWETATPGRLPVDETIRRLETEDAWIILWRAELDPAYGALLDRIMADILGMLGPAAARQIKKREVIIFITSPHRVTSYHIDRECNFLLQIAGSKEISVFSSRDREVLPEEELERFWCTDHNAPVYRPHLQERADVIELRPGLGVHIPINAPHWLRNGDSISVSASFNFQFHDHERADLYRANYYLRKLGGRPRPPFESRLADVCKTPFGALAYRMRQLRHGRGPRD